MTTALAQEVDSLSLTCTTFPTTSGTQPREERTTWRDLCARLAAPQTYSSKHACPLIKLATFGKALSKNNSLRHDGNVLQIFGIEGDYDGQAVPVAQAADKLASFGIAAFFYTSARHTPSAPRWRVLVPLAAPCEPAQRYYYVGLVNAALGGILGRESFTLSQTYFAGRVEGVAFETRRVAGEPLHGGFDLLLEPLYPQGKPAELRQTPDDLDRAAAIARVNETTLVDLRSALHFYESESRQDWILAGQQLKCLGDDGRALWFDWGAGSTKFDDGDDDPAAIWDGFSGQRTDYRALFAEAQRRGWKNPASGSRAGGAVPDVGALPADIGFVDFASLATTQPPPRRWVVTEWLPRGAVTLLSGRGGHGKTLLAQQLAVAVATGRPWLGLEVERGPVVGLFAEDDGDELLRRGARIFEAFEIDPVRAAGALFLDARAGKSNVLVSVGRNHLAAPEPLLQALRDQCAQLKPLLVILDNAAQLFSGDENIRAEVTQFVNQLTAVAREFDCAVLLLGHLAKSVDNEYSGSTAWDAAVRARVLLSRLADGTSILRKAKANYSGQEEMCLSWCAGVFLPVPAGGATPEAIELAKLAIAEAIEHYALHEKAVSELGTARNNVVRCMLADELAGGISEAVLKSALAALLESGEVRAQQVLGWRRNRREVKGLANAQKTAESAK